MAASPQSKEDLAMLGNVQCHAIYHMQLHCGHQCQHGSKNISQGQQATCSYRGFAGKAGRPMAQTGTTAPQTAHTLLTVLAADHVHLR